MQISTSDQPSSVCRVCDDTHRITIGEREVVCTNCPTPCQSCRAGGNGLYCSTPRCECPCHRVNPRPTLQLVPDRRDVNTFLEGARAAAIWNDRLMRIRVGGAIPVTFSASAAGSWSDISLRSEMGVPDITRPVARHERPYPITLLMSAIIPHRGYVLDGVVTVDERDILIAVRERTLWLYRHEALEQIRISDRDGSDERRPFTPHEDHPAETRPR